MLSSITSSLREAFARSKPFNIGGLGEMLRQNWHLGFTAFGGPAVHFQIVSTHGLRCDQGLNTLAYSAANVWRQFHKLFVDKLKWLDEQMVWPD